MQVWQLKDNFCAVCSRLFVILTEQSRTNIKSLEEIKGAAAEDELFKFTLKLLLEEWKCRYWYWRQNLQELEAELQIEEFEDFLCLSEWLELTLAGLNASPFPTVEFLLKKQGKPAVYSELQDAFACTLLLNRLMLSFDVNVEKTQIFFSPIERALFQKLPQAFQELLKRNFDFEAQIQDKTNFSHSPSFKELLHYCAFDSKTEFSSIPLQLLEPCEDSDLGAPFGKRWARRLSAKSAAFDKLYFNPDSHGLFPASLCGASELNFDVQFPDDTDPELLHNNFFELSSLSSEFLDCCSFGMKVSQFLTQIPRTLHRKRLKNTEIFQHFSAKSPVNFRALLLAAGLSGHLSPLALPPVDIYEILNFNSAETTSSLFLGLASSAAVNDCVFERAFLVKLFSMHLSSALTEELEIPPLLQTAAALSLGFFCFKSADRGPSQLLVKEIFRPLSWLCNSKASDSPMLSYCAALSLGFIMMGSLKENSVHDKQFAEDIVLQLKTKMNGHPQYCVSALMAFSLVGFDCGKQESFSFIPWIRSLGDLLERPEPCLFWNIFTWRMTQWTTSLPDGLHDQGEDRVLLDFENVFDDVCQPEGDSVWSQSGHISLLAYCCQVLSANSLFLGLKFAGTPEKLPKELLKNLDRWMLKLLSFPILFSCDADYFLTRIQGKLLLAFQYMLLARCLIFNGRGDEDCWRYLRRLQAHPLLFKYGNAHLYYAALGFAFCGRGESKISTENELGVAGLLASFLPILPTSPGEPEFAILNFLSPFWVLSCRAK